MNMWNMSEVYLFVKSDFNFGSLPRGNVSTFVYFS